MKSFSYETRSLKRPRLGPPDVYPQEPKQKEDELTVTNVKLGFSAYQLSDEFGTARNCNVTASKIGAYFNAIIGKKDEINTLPDSGRKRQQINPKDNFWPATGRTKAAVEAWFKDLSGSKALLSLSKKAPNFNKKEDIYPLLCDFQVPMLRAAWFIKLSSAYTVAVTEAKGKKRQLPDPTQEWTASLLKFLKEQLSKLQEFYQSSSQTTMTEEQKSSLKLWHYTTQLSRYLYQEGLLDRQEMLQWILEQLEKYKNWPPAEDGPLRLVLPVVLQYLEEFVQNELLARKLAYICMGRLAQLCNNQTAGGVSPNSPNHNMVCTTQNNTVSNSAASVLKEYLNCPHHKDVVLSLSVIIQVITLECPTALVWNSIGEGKSASMLNGSPLDILLCSPSLLPMPQRNSNQHLRNQLRAAEEMIKQRSQAAENKWSCDKWQQSCAGVKTQRVLTALDALDRHSFHKVDTNNSLDTLYQKIFPNPPEKNQFQIEKEEPIVNLLCWWAVSGVRYGEHRAIAVAKLLERRNNQIQQGQETDVTDDKDSVNSATPGLPVFQSLLMKYLDNDAPVLDDTSNYPTNRTVFTNLVHLFSELVRHDVFSHDAYMCTLISRGDLLQISEQNVTNPGSSARPSSNKPLETPSQIHLDSDPTALFYLKPSKLQEHGRAMECDDSKIDDDLGELLQTITKEQQNSMDAPDSPKDVSGSLVSGGINHLNSEVDNSGLNGKPSRHLLYTTHFPLPQDESCSHECNQRHVLLYGVGRVRDEARHVVKRTAKDICKLFSKKFSIDVAEGGKVKKHSRNEFNFESTTARVQNLSFFDQHVVTWQCSITVYEMISSFASGNSNYLPVQEHVAFLFDLMELALNIYGLIDVCIQILKEIPEVEAQLDAKGSNLVKTYTTGLVLYIVGVLRRYHCCLLLSGEQTVAVFEGLCRVVKHISNPGDCSSAERCVLSHLYDLYASCNLLKTRPHSAEPFSNAYPKIRAALYSSLTPNQSGNQTITPFLADVIKSVRKGMKIEPAWYRQLNDSSNNRYSFVCNTIMAVCSTNDVDRLNDLGHLSAELTAHCNLLSAEWLGVLTALCYTSSSPSYTEVTSHVDIHDLSIHNSLALFTSILVARHCFSLEDFVVHVALPSLMTVCNEGRGDADLDAEAGARLTCHLLLRLFKTSEVPQPAMYSVGTSPHPLPVNSTSSIKLSCDRHLLAAAHNNIKVGPVLAVLKGILVVGDATAGRGSRGKIKPHKMTPPSGQGELSISHILGTSDSLGGARDELLLELGGGNNISSNGGLSELAQLVLKEMCSEEWVLERCLQRPEDLCTQDMMLDSMLTAKQAQRLLHMICYPDNPVSTDVNLDQKTMITNILENLELWTLRVSWLDMQLMLKQYASNNQELNQWLDIVAKAAINLFNLPVSNKEDNCKGKNSMWLVAPLVAKLPSTVQGRVLKVAGQVLESGNWFTNSAKNKGSTPTRPSSGPHMGHHQPFLALVLTCLKGQDDQREGLLTSLQTQLTQCLQIVKEDRNYICENHKSRTAMQDALLLRFSLIGGMFDTIQRNTTLTTDWAILLVQLVIYGVIDLNNNSELFNTVLDMLATLIHSTLVSDSQSEKCEENRKHYQNLMKKLKKEVGERNSPSIQYVKQLLPLPKKQTEVIACSPSGLVTDMKGNKIAFDSSDKHGLQVSEKQRINPWDILEGQKNLAPLSWPWFGAIRVERRLLPFEETHRLLQCHTHSLAKSSDFYLEPLPLPPEDIDPPKPCTCVYCAQMKGGPGIHESTPPSVDSPRGGKRHMGKQALSTRRKKQTNKPGTPVMQHVQQGGPGPQNQIGQMVGPYNTQGQGGIFPGGPQPSQWGGAPPYQQQHPQQVYYPQQAMQQGAGNPAGPGRVNQSKQALSNMLRMRIPPSSQYIGQNQPQMQNFQPMPRQTMFRQQIQGIQTGMQGNNQSNQMFPAQQQQIYQNIQQQGINQNYGGYGAGGMVTNTGMFPDQPMMRTPEYQQRMRGPYMQQAPNVTMSSMGGPLSQNQPAPPYTRPGAPNQQQQQAQPTPQHFTQQQMNQQRMRQQLMAMQHQNQQQQSQNPTAIVAQLQRQMHSGNQQQNQQHMYQQPPPY
ncbi:mediator of RNA polymerase II transcription subunit 12 isoform X2 [Cimex lectularius]|uniref:Mediator complex subunit Med12 domain-containing protein n=1 Tax=Cimex lectularius TaxID=79782 RepID=A0A8I6R7E6_CIMLE|nr:mediator of RNA polymerase II transcription subunit 12 isoform X2 [Cimex lectularius]